jgi:hypothetical protein
MSARVKGANWERWVVNRLREVWPAARRGLGQSRDGREVADGDRTPYWVECKRDEIRSIDAAVRQAVAATDGRPIVVVSKRNRQEPLATMRLEDWLALHKTLSNGGTP